ncbi:peptidoglycan DD-metalloendopeptidase family protein [Zoogloea sp.]|uniref:peptidoglycan DD-metalloendopeptidase family protein n=1 Tax=Zoogloea sp. TaxID=49181 RepID=UPI0035B020EA
MLHLVRPAPLLLVIAGLCPLPGHAELRPSAVPGGVVALTVAPANTPRPVVRFGGRPVLLQHGAEGWQAVVGLPLDTPPGEHTVEIGPEARHLAFQVKTKAYPEQRLTVKNPKMVTPDPEDLDRIAAERERQLQVRSQFREVPVARTDLDLPTPGRLSSRFGLRRVFNGEPRAPHTGLDVAAPAGAPIRAPADGVVSLVDDLYFNGKTVFVDHGQGFVSMVCHLSEAAVQVGQHVRRGELLGRVGNTGRATGPHLHWSVYLNGAAVDPALFIGPTPDPKPAR